MRGDGTPVSRLDVEEYAATNGLRIVTNAEYARMELAEAQVIVARTLSTGETLESAPLPIGLIEAEIPTPGRTRR